MKKSVIWRSIFYIGGMTILALGLTLNTKTGLGVSPVLSLPFAISNIWNLNFAWTTFSVYLLFVIFQLLLTKTQPISKILLQIPLNIPFSYLLDCFGLIPIQFESFWQNLILLFLAMTLTAIGVSMMVNMQFIPNPADGFTDELGKALHKNFGFGKNVLDITCVSFTCMISLWMTDSIIGIGIGTLISAIGVGRIIAVFQKHCKVSMQKLANITN